MRALLLVAIAILAAGCVGGSPDVAPTPTPSSPTSETMPPAPVTLSVALVETVAPGVPPKTLGIDPARLEVPAGARVLLTVTNEGQRAHNLLIDELGVETPNLAAGESVEVEFFALEAGTYRMYCSLGGDGPLGHAAQGMEGEFIVN